MTTKPATPRTARQRRRPRGYGERPTISQERHYLQVMVYSDCHRKLRDLMDRHNLSASGAAHHLMRLGAGLSPLPPLDHPTASGEEPKP
jgi:hypothetical protein